MIIGVSKDYLRDINLIKNGHRLINRLMNPLTPPPSPTELENNENETIDFPLSLLSVKQLKQTKTNI